MLGVIGGVAVIITLSIPPDNTFTYVIAIVFEILKNYKQLCQLWLIGYLNI